MQFYPIYQPKEEKFIQDLVQTCPYGSLVTTSREGKTHFGVFNHHQSDGKFFLHLHRNDEQLGDLTSTGRALLVFLDFLSVIPSHWVDPQYAGAATSYYRYLEYECQGKIIQNGKEKISRLIELMKQFQPEGGFAPIEAASPIYETGLNTIEVVELTPVSQRAKWKLGQNRPQEVRYLVAGKLGEKDSEGKRAGKIILDQGRS